MNLMIQSDFRLSSKHNILTYQSSSEKKMSVQNKCLFERINWLCNLFLQNQVQLLPVLKSLYFSMQNDIFSFIYLFFFFYFFFFVLVVVVFLCFVFFFGFVFVFVLFVFLKWIKF